MKNYFYFCAKIILYMKVAVIGSRGIEQVDLAKYLPSDTSCIVSGGAKGVDTIAAEYAKSHGIELKEFLPDYTKYPGRIAPLKRNDLIIAECDIVLAFWDGASHGTKYTIDRARKAGKPVKVFVL